MLSRRTLLPRGDVASVGVFVADDAAVPLGGVRTGADLGVHGSGVHSATQSLKHDVGGGVGKRYQTRFQDTFGIYSGYIRDGLDLFGRGNSIQAGVFGRMT